MSAPTPPEVLREQVAQAICSRSTGGRQLIAQPTDWQDHYRGLADAALAVFRDQQDPAEGRLRAAEDVCAVFGWTAVRNDSDRERALTQLWMRWAALAPTRPRDYPHLSEDRIAELAAERQATRTATLARLAGGDR